MKNIKIGLQLYSVRDEMEKDMKGTLQKVKEMGYDYVEFAGYFGNSAEQVRGMLDELGLQCKSVHQRYDLFLEEGVEACKFLNTIGAQYSAIPHMDTKNHKGGSDWEAAVEDITKTAKLLADNGIKMLYHNHEFEFERYEGKFLMDWLYEAVPALGVQIDTCWIRFAGYEPTEYIEKYADRLPIIHLKDFICKKDIGAARTLSDDSGKIPSKEETGFDYRPLGQGINDIPAILEAAERVGALYAIVEQDGWEKGKTSLQSVKESREYLKSIGY